MSHTQVTTLPVAYSKSDIARRHDHGVTKNRKAILTGGGRAWSEDEVRRSCKPPRTRSTQADTHTQQEAYLVQTRLQKMPYKHIAAHLKKTELACRLHYHQLTHGSGRRKRASSVSSASDRSPELAAAMPVSLGSSHRRTESYGSTSGSSAAGDIQLPRIMDSCGSPILPAILPKPVAYSSGFHSSRYLPRMHEELGHLSHYRSNYTTPPPPADRMPLSLPSTAAHTPAHVDLVRLQAVYDAHRDAFWHAIASEYGANASPAVLETAWRTGACCRAPPAPAPVPLTRPITPAASPEAEARRYSMDRTRIASILTDGDGPGRW